MASSRCGWPAPSRAPRSERESLAGMGDTAQPGNSSGARSQAARMQASPRAEGEAKA